MKFDAVIVIGIPENGREDKTGPLYNLGVPIHRWRGFNGTRLGLVADDRTAVRSPGHLGCYLAHAGALRLIQCLPGNLFLIIEDDAVVAHNLAGALQDYHTDADLILFQGSSADLSGLRVPGYSYGVTRAGAAKLVEFLEDRHQHMDFAFGDAVRGGVVKAWFLSDQFVRHEPGLSTTMPGPRGGEYSQWGEQKIIAEWWSTYGTGSPGRFLEIGSADGILCSNTRALAEQGWEGVCVEANPYLFTGLHRIYREGKVKTVCALVWPWHGLRTLHLNQDGLSTCMADTFEKLRGGGVQYFGSCYSPVVTPTELAAWGPYDVVSIDAEGADIEILKHGDMMLAGTKLLIVEKYPPGTEELAKPAAREVMLGTCSSAGFPVVVGETQANLILTRE